MHGTCREVEEISECGYQVWAKGVCHRRSSNNCIFGTINEPIEITGIKIKKNDIIVADQSGVVCIHEELITETLNLLKKISGTLFTLLFRPFYNLNFCLNFNHFSRKDYY